MGNLPSERKDGFGTEGVGEDGDGATGTRGNSLDKGGVGADQRGKNAAEGAFGDDHGAKGRRSPANKQGIAKGDGAQD